MPDGKVISLQVDLERVWLVVVTLFGIGSSLVGAGWWFNSAVIGKIEGLQNTVEDIRLNQNRNHEEGVSERHHLQSEVDTLNSSLNAIIGNQHRQRGYISQ